MQMLTRLLFIFLVLFSSILSPTSAYANCEADQVCGCTNFTNKNESDTWSDSFGVGVVDPSFLSFCRVKGISIRAEVDEGSGYIPMTSSTKIGVTTSNPISVAVDGGGACDIVGSFTFKANSGSGGSTWNCRVYVYLTPWNPACYFTVQVNAPATAGSQMIITKSGNE